MTAKLGNGASNGRVAREHAPERLTSREHEVLTLIGDGLTTTEIARRLDISFKTAACHRSRILQKFGVHNSVALLRQAIRSGLLKP